LLEQQPRDKQGDGYAGCGYAYVGYHLKGGGAYKLLFIGEILSENRIFEGDIARHNEVAEVKVYFRQKSADTIVGEQQYAKHGRVADTLAAAMVIIKGLLYFQSRHPLESKDISNSIIAHFLW